MKARFKKSGKIIGGKAADVFVKKGIAEYLEEPKVLKTEEPDVVETEKVIENVKPVKKVAKRGRKKK